ncbi:hypothetical protein STEG23_037090 [Scotinomys teguina]
MCLLSWFLDPGGWGKAADVGLYFIFPGICTLSLKQQELQKANQKQYAEGKLRGTAPGKKTSGLQQKNVEVKTKKNKQKTPGNGDGISTSETASKEERSPDHPDARMSQVYGAPHLLRLFVQIGAMLAYTPLHEKSLALLLNYLHDFLKYLAKNSAKLFSASDYEVAPAENHRKAINLSFCDLCYSTTIGPKMLVDLLADEKSIPIIGCALQFLTFCVFADSECLLLAVMAFDRYQAISKPLLYTVNMSSMVDLFAELLRVGAGAVCDSFASFWDSFPHTGLPKQVYNLMLGMMSRKPDMLPAEIGDEKPVIAGHHRSMHSPLDLLISMPVGGQGRNAYVS